MSRPAAARQKSEPTIRRARFAEEDLVSSFGEAMLAEAIRLLRAGAVNLTAAGPAIEATIAADGKHHCVALTPTQRGARVAFLGTCELAPLTQTRWAQKSALGLAGGHDDRPGGAEPHDLFRRTSDMRSGASRCWSDSSASIQRCPQMPKACTNGSSPSLAPADNRCLRPIRLGDPG